MKDVLEYKGFAGSVHFRAEDNLLFGKIEGISDLVSFEGQSVTELRTAFEKAVDEYIELCKSLGKRTRKSYRGSFNVRISPELHLGAAEAAIRSGLSLNQFVERAIRHEVEAAEQEQAAERTRPYSGETRPSRSSSSKNPKKTD